ncbi:hypothetical protein C6A85_70960, partial [Mycobacterium sp. ITM-2017-0098]
MTFVFGGLGAAPALAEDPSAPDGSSQDSGDTGGTVLGGVDGVVRYRLAATGLFGAAEEPPDEVTSEPDPVDRVEQDGSGGRSDPVVEEPAPAPVL